jgi:hypothetical protein
LSHSLKLWKAFFSAAGFAAAIALAPLAADAMPNFAQAYGLDCKACHTQVPALNSYGKFIQRSEYAAMDPAIVNKALPIWAGESINFDSNNQGAFNPNAQKQNLEPQWQVGNLAIHVDGLSNDFSFHVQQWLWSNNQVAGYYAANGTQGSDLDTAWVAYNGLFKGDGHILLGKAQLPSPSYFCFWMDQAAFAVPEIAVGQHTYQLDANRWGSKVVYTQKNYFAEAGYYYSDGNLGSAFTFTPPSGQTFEYRVGYASAKSPLTLEFYGANGSLPVQNVDVNGNPYNVNDAYNAQGLSLQYEQRSRWQPGVLLLYQQTYDANPGQNMNPGNQNYGATKSIGYTLEPYWSPFKNWEATISARRQMTDDGLGDVVQSGNVDVNFRITKYLHAYAEAYLMQHSGPGWRYQLWWTTPIFPAKGK